MEAIRPTLPGEADTDAVSPPSPLNTDLPPRGRTRPSVASPSVRGGSGARTAGPAIAITHHNKAEYIQSLKRKHPVVYTILVPDNNPSEAALNAALATILKGEPPSPDSGIALYQTVAPIGSPDSSGGSRRDSGMSPLGSGFASAGVGSTDGFSTRAPKPFSPIERVANRIDNLPVLDPSVALTIWLEANLGHKGADTPKIEVANALYATFPHSETCIRFISGTPACLNAVEAAFGDGRLPNRQHYSGMPQHSSGARTPVARSSVTATASADARHVAIAAASGAGTATSAVVAARLAMAQQVAAAVEAGVDVTALPPDEPAAAAAGVGTRAGSAGALPGDTLTSEVVSRGPVKAAPEAKTGCGCVFWGQRRKSVAPGASYAVGDT